MNIQNTSLHEILPTAVAERVHLIAPEAGPAAISRPLMGDRLVEAARYALLRRLAPALRHNMAGSLQPLAMMAALLEKRLQKPNPDLPALAKNSGSLGALSREAAASCMGLMGWMAPKNNDAVALDAGIAEAVGLVATELSFKGYSVVNNTQGVDAKVAPGTVRSVFMAALIALTDIGAAPANVLVAAANNGGELLISITLVAVDGETMPGNIAAYRDFEWADVQVLADAESVVLIHGADQVELRSQIA